MNRKTSKKEHRFRSQTRYNPSNQKVRELNQKLIKLQKRYKNFAGQCVRLTQDYSFFPANKETSPSKLLIKTSQSPEKPQIFKIYSFLKSKLVQTETNIAKLLINNPKSKQKINEHFRALNKIIKQTLFRLNQGGLRGQVNQSAIGKMQLRVKQAQEAAETSNWKLKRQKRQKKQLNTQLQAMKVELIRSRSQNSLIPATSGSTSFLTPGSQSFLQESKNLQSMTTNIVRMVLSLEEEAKSYIEFAKYESKVQAVKESSLDLFNYMVSGIDDKKREKQSFNEKKNVSSSFQILFQLFNKMELEINRKLEIFERKISIIQVKKSQFLNYYIKKFPSKNYELEKKDLEKTIRELRNKENLLLEQINIKTTSHTQQQLQMTELQAKIQKVVKDTQQLKNKNLKDFQILRQQNQQTLRQKQNLIYFQMQQIQKLKKKIQLLKLNLQQTKTSQQNFLIENSKLKQQHFTLQNQQSKKLQQTLMIVQQQYSVIKKYQEKERHSSQRTSRTNFNSPITNSQKTKIMKSFQSLQDLQFQSPSLIPFSSQKKNLKQIQQKIREEVDKVYKKKLAELQTSNSEKIDQIIQKVQQLSRDKQIAEQNLERLFKQKQETQRNYKEEILNLTKEKLAFIANQQVKQEIISKVLIVSGCSDLLELPQFLSSLIQENNNLLLSNSQMREEIEFLQKTIENYSTELNTSKKLKQKLEKVNQQRQRIQFQNQNLKKQLFNSEQNQKQRQKLQIQNQKLKKQLLKFEQDQKKNKQQRKQLQNHLQMEIQEKTHQIRTLKIKEQDQQKQYLAQLNTLKQKLQNTISRSEQSQLKQETALQSITQQLLIKQNSLQTLQSKYSKKKKQAKQHLENIKNLQEALSKQQIEIQTQQEISQLQINQFETLQEDFLNDINKQIISLGLLQTISNDFYTNLQSLIQLLKQPKNLFDQEIKRILGDFYYTSIPISLKRLINSTQSLPVYDKESQSSMLYKASSIKLDQSDLQFYQLLQEKELIIKMHQNQMQFLKEELRGHQLRIQQMPDIESIKETVACLITKIPILDEVAESELDSLMKMFDFTTFQQVQILNDRKSLSKMKKSGNFLKGIFTKK